MNNVTQIKPAKVMPRKVSMITNRCGLDNPNFKYTPAAATDISVRFDAIYAAQNRAASKQLKKAATK